MTCKQKPAENFEIVLRYGEELDEQLKTGSTDPLSWIDAIYAGNKAIVGGEDTDQGMREYLLSFFGGMLQLVPDVLQGNKRIFVTGNGPIWITVNPLEEDAVRFSFCYSKQSAESSEHPKEYEPSAVVSLSPLVEETIRAAEGFHAYVCEVNPDLNNRYDIQGLQEDIDNAKQAYRAWL